jgi:hypothetical protein
VFGVELPEGLNRRVEAPAGEAVGCVGSCQ